MELRLIDRGQTPYTPSNYVNVSLSSRITH